MIIRQLTNEEIPRAMELKISCWTEELAGQAENTLQLSEQVGFWTNWLKTQDEHNDKRVFIGVFENTQLLGAAAGSFVDSKDAPQEGIELNGLWVFPEYRGRGLSLKMMLYILDTFVPLGVNRMEAYNSHHAPSNAFYRKLGGKVIGQDDQEDGKLLVDIFEFELQDLRMQLEKTLSRYA